MNKTAYFVLIRTVKGCATRVLDGPHDTFKQALPACDEINSCLARAPFAYVRRTANAQMTTDWIRALA